MRAAAVLAQNDGEVTKAYYAALGKKGPRGELAVALFRAQKRSLRAKDYRRGKYRGAAYEVKEWSLGEVVRILKEHPAIVSSYGWKKDEKVVFGSEASWVLYVELRMGNRSIRQCSFHSPRLLPGPKFNGDWDGLHESAEAISQFCDEVWDGHWDTNDAAKA